MAESDTRQTLCLTASFPQNADFAPTAGELASRLAASVGVGEDEASGLGRSVEAAFTKALAAPHDADAPPIDVSLCADERAIDLSVTCGPNSILALSHPRPE